MASPTSLGQPTNAPRRATQEHLNEQHRSGLWLVGLGLAELGHIHHVCVQLLQPQTARDWRTFGAFAAFIVALFVEMYTSR
jgi:hypothetical protein